MNKCTAQRKPNLSRRHIYRVSFRGGGGGGGGRGHLPPPPLEYAEISIYFTCKSIQAFIKALMTH